MKKVLSLVIALMMVFSCASALAELTFTTGSTAGTYYAFGGVLAQYISDHSDVKITAVAGEGSAANIDMLDMHYAQLGFVQSDVAYYAANGIRFEQYEGAPITSFTALAALYNETVQLVTCNPDIKSMDDLRGKNVSIGAAGSGVYFNAMDFLAAYDMTEADINPQYLNFGDSAEALRDGKIDAAFVVAGAPTTAVVDLCATKSAYLVSLDDEHVAKLKELNGAYTECTIPAGTYDGVDTDTKTVAVKAIIIANGDVTDDEAYTIVSTIFDNAEEIASLHAKGAELDLSYAAECGLAYHPGAAKYFAEKGITVKTAE
ncbi:MAG: TAXI family TRAP transporter solute-binding subunit [Candidatus Faecivicinus sp.]|nr:TAXI family TRAP transporter solute-binding subunit [Candidatus Faecivicinus sp.]